MTLPSRPWIRLLQFNGQTRLTDDGRHSFLPVAKHRITVDGLQCFLKAKMPQVIADGFQCFLEVKVPPRTAEEHHSSLAFINLPHTVATKILPPTVGDHQYSLPMTNPRTIVAPRITANQITAVHQSVNPPWNVARRVLAVHPRWDTFNGPRNTMTTRPLITVSAMSRIKSGTRQA